MTVSQLWQDVKQTTMKQQPSEQSGKKIKLSKKGIKIIQTIREKGKYKPAYSDQEPALKTLLKLDIVKWRGDFRGVVLTELGKSININ